MPNDIQNNRHRWTFAEDKFCCEQYIKYYVIDKSSIDIYLLLKFYKRIYLISNHDH